MTEASDGTRTADLRPARDARTVEPAGGSKQATRDAGEMHSLAALGRVERLVANGMSRLTAERMIAIDRDGAEPGRARKHSLARH